MHILGTQEHNAAVATKNVAGGGRKATIASAARASAAEALATIEKVC